MATQPPPSQSLQKQREVAWLKSGAVQRGNESMGRFLHSANYYVVYPRNTPESHPPTEGCMIHSEQHWGCRIQDRGTRGYRG